MVTFPIECGGLNKFQRNLLVDVSLLQGASCGYIVIASKINQQNKPRNYARYVRDVMCPATPCLVFSLSTTFFKTFRIFENCQKTAQRILHTPH